MGCSEKFAYYSFIVVFVVSVLLTFQSVIGTQISLPIKRYGHFAQKKTTKNLNKRSFDKFAIHRIIKNKNFGHTYVHTYIHTYKHTNIHTYLHTYTFIFSSGYFA